MKVDREMALAAALKLLDETGLEKLTMRSLGAALGIQAPSLYHYFPSKRVLLDAMADAIVAPVVQRFDTGRPEDLRMADMAREFRKALARYRDGAQVVSGSYGATPSVLKFADLLLGVFIRHGLDDAAALHATFNLAYYVQGFVVEEQAFLEQWGAVERDAERHMAAHSLEQKISADYPYLRRCLPALLAADFDTRFEAGLDVQLRALDTPPAGQARTSRARRPRT
ncbi:MAG: TetR/AcrR family transcriptional regulator C-terminal domain-containing protein [Lysobacter sp.]